MVNDSIANWQVRAKTISATSFDCENALQLANEIRDHSSESSVSYRALQAIYILESIRRAPKPSERQISDAKMALNSLSRTLKTIKS